MLVGKSLSGAQLRSRALWDSDVRLFTASDTVDFVRRVMTRSAATASGKSKSSKSTDDTSSKSTPVVVEHIMYAEDYKEALAARGALRVIDGVRGPQVFAFVRGNGQVQSLVSESMGVWTLEQGLLRGDTPSMLTDAISWDPLHYGNYWGPPWARPELEPVDPKAPDADYWEQEFDKFHKKQKNAIFFTTREIEAYRAYLECMRQRQKGNRPAPDWKWLDDVMPTSAKPRCAAEQEVTPGEARARIAKLTSKAYVDKHMPQPRVPEFVRAREKDKDVPARPIVLRRGMPTELKAPYTMGGLMSTYQASKFAFVDGKALCKALGLKKALCWLHLVRINCPGRDGRILVSRYNAMISTPHGRLRDEDGSLFHYHYEVPEQPVWLKLKYLWVWGFDVNGLATKCYVPSPPLYAIAEELARGDETEAEKLRQKINRLFT